jgi:hypothetical protein
MLAKDPASPVLANIFKDLNAMPGACNSCRHLGYKWRARAFWCCLRDRRTEERGTCRDYCRAELPSERSAKDAPIARRRRAI